MNGKKPTIISLFAGCGGSSLGYRDAGFQELLAIDFDDNCEKTFKMNFPEIPFWKKDISKITGKEILDFTGIKMGELDVLDGSPPCQSFSRSGRKKVKDLRGMLVFQYSRLVRETRPKVFLIENVCGMVEGPSKGIFKELFIDLKKNGYKVKARILNSKYYGVPQSRDRLIILGVREDLKVGPTYPERQTKSITCQKAIGDIDNSGEEVLRPAGKYAIHIPELKEGRGLNDFYKNTGFNCRRIHHLKPCNTITASWHGYPPGPGLIHYKENRYLTIKELKILASFPESFKFFGKFKVQWKQIGNAVMPKFMEAIARHIRTNILNRIMIK